MGRVFSTILGLSAAGSVMILAVMLLRLVLRRAPKWTMLLLWALVGLRLALPFSFETRISPMPEGADQLITIARGTAAPSNAHAPAAARPETSPLPQRSEEPADHSASADAKAPSEQISGSMGKRPSDVMNTFGTIWAAGFAAMGIAAAVNALLLKRRVAEAVRLEGEIFESGAAASPFLFGLIRPRIYVPFGMDEKQLAYVTAHERMHVKNLDHVWKPLGFLILSAHWFNPIAWAGYALFCGDIEMNCDERVVKSLDPGARADYSQTLLDLAAGRPRITACPIAFGETDIKERVRKVLNYRKPAFWIVAAALLAGAALAVCFLTKPRKEPTGPGGKDVFAEMLDAEYTYEMDGNAVLAVCGAAYTPIDGIENWEAFEQSVSKGEKASVHIWYTSFTQGDDFSVVVVRFEGERFVKTDYERGEDGKWTASESAFTELRSDTMDDGVTVKTLAGGGDHCVLLRIENGPVSETPEPSPSPEADVNDPEFAHFASRAIEMQVMEQLDESYEAGRIPASALNELTFLSIGGDRIEDVSDLKHLGRLKELYIYDAPNVDLGSISALPGLTELTLIGSGVRDISFVSGMTSLETLALSDNDIEDISPVAALGMLRTLDFENNRVNDISPLFGMDGLVTVKMSWNPIPLEQVEKLRSAAAERDGGSGSSVTCYTADRRAIGSWPMDLDGDGEDEYFCAMLSSYDTDVFNPAWIEDGAGRRIGGVMGIGTGIVAQGTYARVESPEFGECLMRIQPEYVGGDYSFCLMRIENGTLATVYDEILYSREASIDVEPDNWTQIDPEKAADYESWVNALLMSGHVLVTTDQWGVMRGELYDMSTGGRIVPDTEMLTVIDAFESVGPGVDAWRNKPGALVVDGPLGYRLEVKTEGGE